MGGFFIFTLPYTPSNDQQKNKNRERLTGSHFTMREVRHEQETGTAGLPQWGRE
jgi:hypothetical protein